MAIPVGLTTLEGKWSGAHQLWLTPDDPVRECDITATIEIVAQGQAWQLRYTWFEDTPQDGVLLLTQRTKTPAITAFWLDSWHMVNQHMVCEGEADGTGSVSVKGSYRIDGYPDWGWRITIVPNQDGTWQLEMYNITPEGEEALGVQAKFVRVGSGGG